jgi:hypothetical protein
MERRAFNVGHWLTPGFDVENDAEVRAQTQ